MSDKIFINYRRDDSIGMAGRLHDRLAQTFGRDRLFMDVDHIPVGADFVAHLNSQVAACEVVLVVIGRNWLRAKDKAGQRRLHQPDDFVAIEIAAALARDIRVIPVLVDGARMPKESELPDSLKPLARRQAVDVRHSHFGHDAEALVKRMREALGEEVPVAREREALGDEKAGPGRWRIRATIGAAAVAVLLLIGWGGYELILYMKADIEEAFRDVRQRAELDKQAALEAAVKAQQELQTKHQAEQAEQQRVPALKAGEDRRAKAAAEAEAKRKVDEAEQQRLAAVKAEQERQARAAEAEAKRKSEQAEQQRLAALRVEQERQSRTAAEAEAKRKADQIEQEPALIYSPWMKVCGAGPDTNNKRVCVTTKDGRLEKNGEPAAIAQLFEPEGEAKLLRVTVPLGMQLAHGTRLIIDQQQPAQSPYKICLSVGCMADYPATDDMITKMKRGQTIKLQAINIQGKPISLPLPLNDFAKAYDGPPTDPKVFAEQQKNHTPSTSPIEPSDLANLVYSPWMKVCGAGPDTNNKRVCVTTKDGRLEKNGEPAAIAQLFEPEGEAKLLRVTVPLGMQLAHGTRLIIDQQQSVQSPYKICLSGGCMADYPATDDMITKMKRGQTIKLQAINMQGKPISLPLPLNDFAKAYDGPPTDPKVFEEQQKKLQEQLERRPRSTSGR